MKNLYRFIVIMTAILINTGCQTRSTASTTPLINTLSTQTPLTLAILDHRPYVLNHKKSSAFEGVIRSRMGMPYSHTTANNQAMAEYLTQQLEAGLIQQAIETTVVKTSPSMSLSTSIDAISQHSTARLLFVLHDWQYDIHPIEHHAWYNVDVMIFDKKGKRRLVKNFKGDNGIPEDAEPMNAMKQIYKQRFEAIFNDPEVHKALQ